MDKQQVADAVNLLIAEDHYTKRLKQILEIVEDWDDSPRVFADKLVALNALVDIGLDDMANLQELFALVESRRKLVPLMKKVDYQRNLMREKRDRLAKAVKLEELVRGKTLTQTEREKYKKSMNGKWVKEKTAYIAAQGELSWKGKNEATREFWEKIDAQLTKDLAEAERVLSHAPVKRKRTVKVERTYGTLMETAFKRAKQT